MAQSVSNDALWEKLSEIDKKIDACMTKQSTPSPSPKQVDITPEIKELNDIVLTEIEVKANLLGAHSQSHFDANKKNIISLGESLRKILNVVNHIRKQQIETIEQTNVQNTEQPKMGITYFDFKLFKLKKTSLIITTLGVLVFILTLFCMKQQNDYSLMVSEYNRQGLVIREMQIEMDSLSVNKEIR